jgi:hypothetical protein
MGSILSRGKNRSFDQIKILNAFNPEKMITDAIDLIAKRTEL